MRSRPPIHLRSAAFDPAVSSQPGAPSERPPAAPPLAAAPQPPFVTTWQPPEAPPDAAGHSQHDAPAGRTALIGMAMAWRWLAVPVTIAAATALTMAAHDLADKPGPWMSLRDDLHWAGYTLVVLNIAAVLVGALLQTPSAVILRGRVGAGWTSVAALVTHHVLVAVVAIPLAAVSPEPDPSYGRYDPAANYPLFLGFALTGLTVLAITGVVFLRFPADGTAPDSAGRRSAQRKPETEPLLVLFLAVGAISWFGALMFSINLIWRAVS
ncbi:hypothetical protein AMIS_26560 [Actinoplanes missouriensis 431]|uniref:Uncharacterized protein n=1 Tax=Actinoplanes missouriensis (strain ATCC 14538 / DSM 43046 / CBS 188.64 / JCM 3121 / NBRC 102363 / NCIMB 12654 / NRRL B-3342 / UNCC 431) TaxID=512565 RepID=I0H4D9_ACTM4|nr:hypothetical protein [Actinoplanes missouriensis]BAL87876.1 hypothetical protein AMIS_26560 [Actinoplanes missouriensis 431]